MSDTTDNSNGTASTDAGAGDGGGALPTNPPAPDSGAPTGDAGALAAQLEAANRRARDEQGRADRLQAQLAALAPAAPPAAPEPPATGGITLEQLRAEQRRVREFLRAETALQEEFGSADPSIFDEADTRFDTVEAFRAAVEASHRSIEERVASALTAKEQELRQRYADTYGPLEIDTPGAEAPAGGDGMPTVAQLRAMSLPELDAFEAANPGAIDRIIATANRKA